MKYPYIGEDKDNGNITLFTGENKGVVVKNKAFELGSYSNHWAEFAFKNITKEYLANTYGEVKSKEHAHFIVELGEGAGYELCGSVSPNRAGVFAFDGENKTLFFMLGGGSLRGGSVLKQITIPLPPESKGGDSLNENGDNLIFGDADKCKEWPCVGSKVTWGNCSYTAEVIAIHNNMAWVFTEGEYHTEIAVSKLQKPKTPEQELRDELISAMDNSNTAFQYAEYLAKYLLDQYTLTKKPQ